MSEKGRWIKGNKSDKFLSSLVVDNSILEPGKYVIMVSPIWNEESNQSPEHKQIFVEVLSTQQLSFKKLDADFGYNVLAESLKGLAE